LPELIKSFENVPKLIILGNDTNKCKSHGSLVGIATGYGLDDQGSGVRFSARAENFSLLHHVQTCSDAHPSTYPMGIGDSFPESKAAGS
jgi:hypothetical protein